MWIYTENKRLINLDHVTEIYASHVGNDCWSVYVDKNVLRSLVSEKQAQAFVKNLSDSYMSDVTDADHVELA